MKLEGGSQLLIELFTKENSRCVTFSLYALGATESLPQKNPLKQASNSPPLHSILRTFLFLFSSPTFRPLRPFLHSRACSLNKRHICATWLLIPVDKRANISIKQRRTHHSYRHVAFVPKRKAVREFSARLSLLIFRLRS